ncbi:hypothetical protein E8E15_002472 [Penicillium rubens]|nr:hypothetical protein E8E15_002472 [Penicillium rubens]
MKSVTGTSLFFNRIRFISETNALKGKRPSANLEDIRQDILGSFMKGALDPVEVRSRRDLPVQEY